MSTNSSASNSPLNTDQTFEKGKPNSGVRQRSLSIERKRNESKVNEHKLGINVDKHSLDFNLKGDLCPVVDKDDKARVVTDTVTFTNTENKKRYFYVAVDPSSKWEITVTPMKGEVQSKKTQTFTVTLRVFLSTKVKSFIDVFFSDNKTTAKEAMKARLNKTPDNKRRDAYPITMIIHLETIFSPRLDLDEVEEKERIGRGGNGEVWKVIWRNSEYALKKFRAEDILPEERQMIDREITLMRSFPPNKYLVSYAASTVLPEQPLAILMEYCPKGSLADYLKKKSNLENRFRVKLAIDISKGMSWLHSNKIYHRDLKPGNLLMISDQEESLEIVNVKITDFGTSRAFVSHNLYMKSGSNLKKAPADGLLHVDLKADLDSTFSKGVGTLQYTAPEMLEGREDYDLEKLDIYSFGIVLWELFTQVVPYTEPANAPYCQSKWELINWVKKGERLDLSAIKANVPVIASLIERCWAQDPTKRPTFKEIEKILLAEYEQLSYEPKLSRDVMIQIGYRGTISRETAQSALSGTTNGTFLTRWSTAQQSYVISYRKDGTVGHITGIKQIGNRIQVVSKDFDNIASCVKQFIEQHKISKPLPLPEDDDKNYEEPDL